MAKRTWVNPKGRGTKSQISAITLGRKGSRFQPSRLTMWSRSQKKIKEPFFESKFPKPVINIKIMYPDQFLY